MRLAGCRRAGETRGRREEMKPKEKDGKKSYIFVEHRSSKMLVHKKIFICKTEEKKIMSMTSR